jgi:uncharacterized oligopeptide transporter (OPT) family protein
VAETLSVGLSGIPHSALVAMAIAAACGVALALIERRFEGRYLLLEPSGATVGLAFVIPAGTRSRCSSARSGRASSTGSRPRWSSRFLLSIAAGLVAGESLYGVMSVWL